MIASKVDNSDMESIEEIKNNSGFKDQQLLIVDKTQTYLEEDKDSQRRETLKNNQAKEAAALRQEGVLTIP